MFKSGLSRVHYHSGQSDIEQAPMPSENADKPRKYLYEVDLLRVLFYLQCDCDARDNED